MSGEEFSRNELSLEKLHEMLDKAIEEGDPKKILWITGAIKQLEAAQTDAENGSGEFMLEQQKLEESKKQFKVQVATTVGTTVGLGIFGYILERTGGLVTVEPLKVFLKSLTDGVLHPFKKH